jgi:hypothetical protein
MFNYISGFASKPTLNSDEPIRVTAKSSDIFNLADHFKHRLNDDGTRREPTYIKDYSEDIKRFREPDRLLNPHPNDPYWVYFQENSLTPDEKKDLDLIGKLETHYRENFQERYKRFYLDDERKSIDYINMRMNEFLKKERKEKQERQAKIEEEEKKFYQFNNFDGGIRLHKIMTKKFRKFRKFRRSKNVRISGRKYRKYRRSRKS